MAALTHETPPSRWLLLIALSAFAIIMLPRQFHVTVVENRTPRELKLAGILMPIYLIAINIFVLPAAIAGVLMFGGSGDADLYVLSLPLEAGSGFVSLLTFIGGFSAATAMVIVASVALAIMVSNDMVLPIFLRQKLLGRPSQREDFAKTLLHIRRTAIFGVLLLGYVYFRSADNTTGLAKIGLLSFTAIAQIAPAMFGGLIWRRANARGAIAGLTIGFLVWAYLLFLPSLGAEDHSWIASAVLGFLLPGLSMFEPQYADPLVNATIFSLLVNTLAFVIGSLSRNPRPVERIQSAIFIKRQPRSNSATRGWKTSVAVGDLKAAAGALPVDRARLAALRQEIGSRPVWLAASTHQGDDAALNAKGLAALKAFGAPLSVVWLDSRDPRFSPAAAMKRGVPSTPFVPSAPSMATLSLSHTKMSPESGSKNTLPKEMSR